MQRFCVYKLIDELIVIYTTKKHRDREKSLSENEKFVFLSSSKSTKPFEINMSEIKNSTTDIDNNVQVSVQIELDLFSTYIIWYSKNEREGEIENEKSTS